MATDIGFSIRNYGPLNNDSESVRREIYHFKRFSVIKGDIQGTQSDVLRLLSALAWAERNIVMGICTPHGVNIRSLTKLLKDFGLPETYIMSESVVEYKGAAYTIRLANKRVSVKPSDGNGCYACPDIAFFPSSRNLISVLEKPWEVKGLPVTLEWLAARYRDVIREWEDSEFELTDGYTVKFLFNDTSLVSDPNGWYNIPLWRTPCGIQYLVPLLPVADSMRSDTDVPPFIRLKNMGRPYCYPVFDAVGAYGLRDRLMDNILYGKQNAFSELEKAVITTAIRKFLPCTSFLAVELPELGIDDDNLESVILKLVEDTPEDGTLIMATQTDRIPKILKDLIAKGTIRQNETAFYDIVTTKRDDTDK